MPMATEPFGLSRRAWLALIAGASGLPALGASAGGNATAATRLLAAWQCEPRRTDEAARYQVGVLVARPGALAVQQALDVPTRAHGLLVEPQGTVLAVARRPGDWLLRWWPGMVEPQMAWTEPDRALNGHVIASADGRRLYTTETDLDTGAGLLGVRDAATLEKEAEWSTQGMDPHELLLDADGSLLVANGGIPTLPETGRLKMGVERMDASLVRLDARRGRVQGQWRLPDARLSLRHIAWGGATGQRVVGIALQAEHDDPAARQAAPLLAVFNGRTLRTYGAPRTLGGYGGDIAWTGSGFAVSCPRVDGVALYRTDGGWQDFMALDEACSLAAATGAGLWAGGRSAAVERLAALDRRLDVAALRLDNHWVVLDGRT